MQLEGVTTHFCAFSVTGLAHISLVETFDIFLFDIVMSQDPIGNHLIVQYNFKLFLKFKCTLKLLGNSLSNPTSIHNLAESNLVALAVDSSVYSGSP